MSRSVATVVKDCGTVGNTVDKLKNEINDMKKRLAKVE